MVYLRTNRATTKSQMTEDRTKKNILSMLRSSIPNDSVIELVVDPAIITIRVDSLGYATKHAGFANPKHGPPAASQRSLKFKGACSSIPSNSVIELVVNPAMMAI